MKKEYSNSTLKELGFLIGTWRTEGEVQETSTSKPIKIVGTDIYEWTLNGSFILHRVDVMMGDVKTEVLEFIGEYDRENKIYQMRSFDSTGTFTTMRASFDNSIFEIDGGKVRAKLSPRQTSMNAYWEISENGKNWKPWMVLTLSRSSKL